MGSYSCADTYVELAKKVAELQFRNREHVLALEGARGGGALAGC